MLAGKRILVTGVLNDSSIAFSVARLAQEQGAEVVLTSFGRAMSLTRRAARRLPSEPPIVELDVSDPAQLDGLAAERGYVDDVVAAVDTRRALAAALARIGTKREVRRNRRHSNSPL